MKIPVGHAQRFEVTAPPSEVFALIADVPRSVGHFPGVDTLAPLGDGVFRWELEPISVLNVSHQIIYANRYASDDDGCGVRWTPVDNIGNSVIGGRWRLEACDTGTLMDFAVEGQLDVPLPAPLRRIAAPFVRRTFQAQVQQYLDNLQIALGASQ